MEVIGILGPLLFLAFWIFVIWAFLTLVGTLREIRSEMRTIIEYLEQISSREVQRPSSGAPAIGEDGS